MPTLKTPKDKRNNAERYKPKKKAGSGRTISDRDKAIMGKTKGRTISERDIALIAKALGIPKERQESKPIGRMKAMSDRPKTNKSPVKSRMMNKDGSDPLMKKKAYGGMAKKKMKAGGKLVGDQSKIDRDKNGVINAKDFKIMNKKAYGGKAKKPVKKMYGGTAKKPAKKMMGGMAKKKKMMGGGMMKKKR